MSHLLAVSLTSHLLASRARANQVNLMMIIKSDDKLHQLRGDKSIFSARGEIISGYYQIPL